MKSDDKLSQDFPFPAKSRQIFLKHSNDAM